MKKLFFLLLLACYGSILQAQQLTTFTPQQLRQDLDSLVTYLEEVHPNLYGKYPRKTFYTQLSQIKRQIESDLTLLEFYKRASPLLAKLGDGHIDFKIKAIYNATNPYVLPHHFKLSPKAPFITYQHPYSGFSAAMPAQSTILSINTISAYQIAQDVINRVTGEDEVFRAEYGGNELAMFLELLYPSQGTYKIVYKHHGKVHHQTIQGVRKQSLPQQKQSTSLTRKNCYHFHLEQDSIGVMQLKCLEWEGLKPFLDSSFTLLKQRTIKTLIIDLIDNGGGESDVGDEFLNYLLDHPYKQYDRVFSQNSRFVKRRLLDQLKGKTPNSEQQAFLNKKNGTIDTLTPDQTIPSKYLPLRYQGRLMVLVNRQTYSSAADFAQCVKHYGRGEIIGEETGGKIKSFGDIVTLTLPNTKLQVVVSSKLYINVGAKEGEWGGVVPSIVSAKQNALEMAIKQISAKRKNKTVKR